MTLSNQSHFPGFFLSPESHLIGFCKSYKTYQEHEIMKDDLPGPGQFRLMKSRNWPGPGKSSSGITKVTLVGQSYLKNP
jgi:hypothetical protein